MKVLIADDHVLLAQAIADVLQRSDEFSVKVVQSRQAVLEEMSSQSYDVVLLDLRMPGMHGLSSVVEIVKRWSDTNIVLFTGQVDRKFLADAMGAGLRGYIPKSMPLKSLEVALKLIDTGQVFVPQMEATSDEGAERLGNGGGALTDRELHVLRFASEGATNKEIARLLAVPETQIKMIMRSVCAKLPARNRAHASVIARERMLI
jgi:two-component system nitrate/nitrite response regulator NarP